MPDRPNILVFMTDQQRGCTVLPDHPLKADTPHLDRFREQAATFSRAYCPSPHCCPSRTTFFTGLMPTQHGVWHNVHVPNAIARGPFPGTPFWSEALKAAGYRLGFSGKWHVSNTDGPARWGWEEGLLTAGPGRPDLDLEDRRGHALNGLRNKLERLNPEPYGPRQPGQVIREGFPDYRHYGTADNPFRDGDVTADGCRQLDALAAAGEPWCLYVGTLGPHDPYTPPEAFLDLYPEDDPRIQLPDTFWDSMQDKPELYRRTRDRFDQLSEAEHRAAIRHYLAFCSYEDALFGQVLDRLEASGQADDTLVVFLSDHGDYLGDHGLWAKGLPAFQSAYHVPAVSGCLPARIGRPLPERRWIRWYRWPTSGPPSSMRWGSIRRFRGHPVKASCRGCGAKHPHPGAMPSTSRRRATRPTASNEPC
jgi:arylsulfatase A-like enzyme